MSKGQTADNNVYNHSFLQTFVIIILELIRHFSLITSAANVFIRLKMASSNHEVMVILSDGKPVTVIKARDDRSSVKKGSRTPGRNVSLESPCKDDKDNHFVTSVKCVGKFAFSLTYIYPKTLF